MIESHKERKRAQEIEDSKKFVREAVTSFQIDKNKKAPDCFKYIEAFDVCRSNPLLSSLNVKTSRGQNGGGQLICQEIFQLYTKYKNTVCPGSPLWESRPYHIHTPSPTMMVKKNEEGLVSRAFGQEGAIWKFLYGERTPTGNDVSKHLRGGLHNLAIIRDNYHNSAGYFKRADTENYRPKEESGLNDKDMKVWGIGDEVRNEVVGETQSDDEGHNGFSFSKVWGIDDHDE
eukprot:g1764.t1